MATIIKSTDTLRLSATFIDHDPDTGEEIPVVADSVSGYIYKWNPTTETFDSTGIFSPTPGPTPGNVYYDWVPGSNGLFKIIFEATIETSNFVQDVRTIYVGALEPAKSLVATETYMFLGEFEPFYLDPEAVLVYYPEGDPVEIAEKIYRFSKELEYIVGKSPITDLTPLMQNFILASVLCELSRIYVFDGGLAGFTKANSFRLGDLQVDNSSGSGNSGNGNGDVGSWCELAAMLRDQLSWRSVNLKAVVKGADYCNPIPPRHFKKFD